MFKEAIKSNKDAVKPMATAYKTPYSDELVSNMFSITLINDEGWALTTKTIADNIVVADKIHNLYADIKKELIENKVPPKKIYKKYKLNEESALILKNVFLNTISSWSSLKMIAHDYLDMALIKFEDPEEICCSKFPVFAKKNSEQGEFLCRLGYPYPEFKAFRYNHSIRDLELNQMIEANLQIFPLEGMLTRYLVDEKGNNTLFELSNHSFIGQAGGPIINSEGLITGMLVKAAYKDSEFDIDASLKRGLNSKEVKQSNFIPFSICLNVEAITEFLDKHGVKYKTKG